MERYEYSEEQKKTHAPELRLEDLKERLLSSTTPTSFDDRFVQYDIIHGITPEDWTALVDAVDAQPGEHILEACCGYGDATKHILQSIPEEKRPARITLLDASSEQLQRARQLLVEEPGLEFTLSSLISLPFPDNSQDTVVVKMGIHEMPQAEQEIAFREIHRVLKPGGKFVLWDLALYPETTEFWNKIIREKDTLCGFNSLVRNRHFMEQTEIFGLYHDAGFSSTYEAHRILPRLSTRARFLEMISKELKAYPALCTKMKLNKNLSLEEIPLYLRELAEERLQKLMHHIRAHSNAAIEKIMQVEDLGNDIIYTQRKGIFVGYKTS